MQHDCKLRSSNEFIIVLINTHRYIVRLAIGTYAGQMSIFLNVTLFIKLKTTV